MKPANPTVHFGEVYRIRWQLQHNGGLFDYSPEAGLTAAAESPEAVLGYSYSSSFEPNPYKLGPQIADAFRSAGIDTGGMLTLPGKDYTSHDVFVVTNGKRENTDDKMYEANGKTDRVALARDLVRTVDGEILLRYKMTDGSDQSLVNADELVRRVSRDL